MIARNTLTPSPRSPIIRPAMPVDSETVPVGQSAPDFELKSIDGQTVHLSELRGKPVVLVFLRGFM